MRFALVVEGAVAVALANVLAAVLSATSAARFAKPFVVVVAAVPEYVVVEMVVGCCWSGNVLRVGGLTCAFAEVVGVFGDALLTSPSSRCFLLWQVVVVAAVGVAHFLEQIE